MTPKAQQLAIAEACPRAIKQERGFWFYHQLDENGVEYWHACKNNDPLSDLNAIHEAEKVLTDEQYLRFKEYLSIIVGTSGHLRVPSAVAAQRTEAFLRTLNLWDDSK